MTTFAEQHASERIHHNRRLARVREAQTDCIEEIRASLVRFAQVAQEESLLRRGWSDMDVIRDGVAMLRDHVGDAVCLDEYEPGV